MYTCYRSSVFLQNAILIKDYNMVTINVLTLSLGLIYLAVFYSYTKEKVMPASCPDSDSIYVRSRSNLIIF